MAWFRGGAVERGNMIIYKLHDIHKCIYYDYKY